MNSFISSIITIFLTVPLLGFFIIFVINKLITKNARKSFHKALDYSNVLFILAVHFLLITIWGKSFFWWILLILIIIAMVFVVIHWRIKGEIIFTKVFKGFWRFNFLIFFLAYISLTLFGILRSAVTFTFS
ncbi:DUF3397 domain-containing protein [Neobacillus sp. YX16]|uniref:DUF3397 domain-containing protein n=1 Tax=Bacillaceae TaxID=186817 RepID=UPI000BA66367|nr:MULTISPECIES: DUF3397 domain-containing protein [Bacillaceae]PAE43302.1 hypothetical protein CHI06_07225 [Bacillus sp. 7884-1]TDL72642.1 DUF3397 domain-containing protein [Rhodococcus qingshengii]WHZ04746.1 DUF3397 domain-containing protein [Neobacillus sp. YX16]